MFASEYINNMLPVLMLTDTCETALNWMAEFHINQLIVIEQGKYLGIVSEENIIEKSDPKTTISKCFLDYKNTFILENQHFYDALRLFATNKIKIIAVLDDAYLYKGAVSSDEIVKGITDITSACELGSVLVLEVGYHNYSLTEISRIIEENNSRILSVHVSPSNKKKDVFFVTVKINVPDISSIISTFKRYQYKVVTTFSESKLTEYHRQRFDSLMKYLDF